MSGVVTVSRALTPRNWTSTSDPTNGWDAADGVRVGDHWYNTTTGNIFVCVTNAVGAAQWRFIPRTLAQSGTAASVTGTASETALATIAIPAGAIGVNGAVEVVPLLSVTNSANNKTIRVRIGASGGGFTGTMVLNPALTTVAIFRPLVLFHVRGAQNAQVYFQPTVTAGGLGTNGSSVGTAVVDTSAASEIVISGQLANTGETITLESYSAILTRPDIT